MRGYGAVPNVFSLCSIRPNLGLQFSKNNIPFILPKFGNNPVVVLPPSQVRELVRKPDDELDLHVIHWEQLANRYTSRPEIYLNPVHLSVVRRQLTRKLPAFSDDLYREMVASFTSSWGTEKASVNKVAVYPSCIKIVSRAANRVLSGVELCKCSNDPTHVTHLTLKLYRPQSAISYRLMAIHSGLVYSGGTHQHVASMVETGRCSNSY